MNKKLAMRDLESAVEKVWGEKKFLEGIQRIPASTVVIITETLNELDKRNKLIQHGKAA